MTGRNQKLITVMTWNAYFGMDVGLLLSATNAAKLLAAYAKMWDQVQSTNIPERAEKLAEEIARTKPDLVGLQELAQFFTTVMGNTVTRYDFLESIIQALSKVGHFYVPLAIKNNLDRTARVDAAGSLVRILDRDAVLLRIDQPTRSRVRPLSVRSEAFSTLFQLSNALVGPIAVPRSWIAVDAMVGEGKFRLIETHLESLSPTVQMEQARELLAGPARVELPVIMVGDFNSNPDTNEPPGAAATYGELIAAGFEDVWTTLKANTPGVTCCQQPDLLNTTSELHTRIDLVLIRGGLKPIEVNLVGEQLGDRTPSGLWPSDHAGVVATLLLP